MQIYFSLLIAILGLAIYYISTNPKHVEVGKLMFFSGLLAFMLGGGVDRAIQLIPKGT